MQIAINDGRRIKTLEYLESCLATAVPQVSHRRFSPRRHLAAVIVAAVLGQIGFGILPEGNC